MLPDHRPFGPIEVEDFPKGNGVHTSLEKMTGLYPKSVFWSSAHRFVEEFASILLSTVSARSMPVQGVNFFYPPIVIGVGDHSAFFVFGQLLDGLIVCGREKTSKMRAWEAEFQTFVLEQRQLECHTSSKHSDISIVLPFLAQQSRCHSRRRLYREVSVWLRVVFFFVAIEHCYAFRVFWLTTMFPWGPEEDIPKFLLNSDQIALCRPAVKYASSCVQNFVRNSLFTQRDFFKDNGFSMLLSAVNVASTVC